MQKLIPVRASATVPYPPQTLQQQEQMKRRLVGVCTLAGKNLSYTAPPRFQMGTYTKVRTHDQPIRFSLT